MQIVKTNEKNFSLNALYKHENYDVQKISVIFENNKKRIEKNGKRISDRKELINTIPCILFCHDDLKFATGEPENRRFFIDQSLTMYDASYIDEIRNYKKILKSRNLILKNHEYEMLDTFDNQLAAYGVIIQQKRKKSIFEFNEIFSRIFAEITGIEGVSIQYDPSWKSENVQAFLLENRDRDKFLETSLSGPHRDRINFVKDHKLFIPTASTGQCRLVSLLLRVAQAVYLSRATGLKPVLLMDDVLLELDPNKRAKLTSLLPDYDQLFCTFLPGEPYERYMHDTTKVYKIEGGQWYEGQ